MGRKEGYYWVKLPHNEFEPAKYTVSGFWLLNGKMYFEDSDFAEINERMIVRKNNNETSSMKLDTGGIIPGSGDFEIDLK